MNKGMLFWCVAHLFLISVEAQQNGQKSGEVSKEKKVKFLVFSKESLRKIESFQDFEEKIQSFNLRLEKMKENFNKKMQPEIEEFEKMKPGDEKDKKREEIERKFKNFKRRLESISQSANERAQSVYIELGGFVEKAASEISVKKYGGVVVLDASVVITLGKAGDVADISDLVVAEVNAKCKTIDLELPEV